MLQFRVVHILTDSQKPSQRDVHDRQENEREIWDEAESGGELDQRTWERAMEMPRMEMTGQDNYFLEQ
jgi:hypothetical protein